MQHQQIRWQRQHFTTDFQAQFRSWYFNTCCCWSFLQLSCKWEMYCNRKTETCSEFYFCTTINFWVDRLTYLRLTLRSESLVWKIGGEIDFLGTECVDCGDEKIWIEFRKNSKFQQQKTDGSWNSGMRKVFLFFTPVSWNENKSSSSKKKTLHAFYRRFLFPMLKINVSRNAGPA